MKVYIAGPIAGYPDGNRAEFRAVEAYLRSLGHETVNPHHVPAHRHEGDCPLGPMGEEGHAAPCHMRTDIIAMLGCDAIYMLDGWQESGGARIEYLVAVHVCGLHFLNMATHRTPLPPKSVRDAFALEAIDVVHLARQHAWGVETFGPDYQGTLAHIEKEIQEVRDDEGAGKNALPEWVDLILLSLGGAMRTGSSPQQVIAAVKDKHARNEQRTWPDWRTAEPGKAIEHDRTGEVRA